MREHATCPAVYLNADVVERTVIEHLTGEILTSTNLRAMLERQHNGRAEQTAAREAERTALQKRMAQLQRKIDNLLKLAEMGNGLASVQERLQQRELERNELEAELQRLSHQPSVPEYSPEALDQLEQTAREALQNGDRALVRRVLQAFIVKIEAKKEGGKLYYGFPQNWDDESPGEKSSYIECP